MRRRIRLSGRKQLPTSCVNVALEPSETETFLRLKITDWEAFKGFPKNAKVRVKLNENKKVQIVDYGTIGNLAEKESLNHATFQDPGCQLRVVEDNDENKGVILGSTKEWRLETNKYPDKENVRGIIQFLPADIRPRTWKLVIKDDEHPVIMVDKRIPDARSWARSNPIFLSSVMPVIIEMVFTEILKNSTPEDLDWMNDWLIWADSIMPGEAVDMDDEDGKQKWIGQLVDTFCIKHELSDVLVTQMMKEE